MGPFDRSDLVEEEGAHRRAFSRQKYSREKFTFQMSDHLFIWIQIKTDIEDFRLNDAIQHPPWERPANRYPERIENRGSGARAY